MPILRTNSALAAIRSNQSQFTEHVHDQVNVYELRRSFMRSVDVVVDVHVDVDGFFIRGPAALYY